MCMRMHLWFVSAANITAVVVEDNKIPLLLKAKALFDSDLKLGYDSSNSEQKVAAKPCPLKLVVKMGDVKCVPLPPSPAYASVLILCVWACGVHRFAERLRRSSSKRWVW
jgi:hypothetical protein